MTILYLFYEYLAEGTGGLHHVWEVTRHLKEQGHRVIIFAPRCGTYRVKTPVEVVYVPVIDRRFFRFLSFHFNLIFFAGFYLAFKKVDIIYVREMALSLTPFVLSKLFQKPMITEINGDILTEYKRSGHPPLVLSIMRRVEMVTCRASQALVCVTDGLRSIFEHRYQLNRRKVVVIPNGTDPNRFYPLDQNDCRKRLGLDISAPVIGFVGTFVHHQGLNYLIQSSSIILANLPNAIFLLVGDGPARKAIEGTIQTKGLRDHFILTGGVALEEVVFFINAMDVCVAPFTRGRNERIGLSPLKIYDYLACGKPVVASDIKGVGDLLKENGVGIAVAPEDPVALANGILQSLEKQDLIRRCLHEGPAIVKEDFTWEITSRKVTDICSRVMNS